MISRQSNAKAKIRRQNRANAKSRFSLKWDNPNYDYLLRRAEEEGISVAALANQIVRRERQKVLHGTLETS